MAGFLVVAVPLSPFAIVRAIAVPVVLVVLTARHLGAHPHPGLGPANHLTLFRAGLVGLLASGMFEADALPRWGLVFVACVAFGMDGIDGWLARRTGTASPFGAQLDMELDGLFVLVLCGLVVSVNDVGPWVWSAGLARYLFVAGALVWPFLARPLPPTRRRPWACGLGVGLLIGSLAPVPAVLALTSAWLGVAAIVGSFAIDVVWLVRHRAEAG